MNYPRYVEIDLTAKTVKVSTWKGGLTEGGHPIWTANSDLKAGKGRVPVGGDALHSIFVSITKDGDEIAIFEAE